MPVGKDGFFNEVHCKLRPVETVMDGILIAGSAQGPKNVHETTISAMASVAKSAGLLMKGYVDLEPFVAVVDSDLCEWCDDCKNACPYDAISKTEHGDKAIARINTAVCKGCGTCVPACAEMAINVEITYLLAYRVAWLQSKGELPVAEASISKIRFSELQQKAYALAVQIMGLYGPLKEQSKYAPLYGREIEYYLWSISFTFGGGTNEIQRDIIATKGLGLPRYR